VDCAKAGRASANASVRAEVERTVKDAFMAGKV
jgi:hypothetical protein